MNWDKEQHIRAAAQQVMVQANLDAIKEVFSEDYVAHAGSKRYEGHAFLTRWTKQIHKAINHIKITSILVLSEDEHTITWQRTLTGKHKKSLRGIPASDKKVTWTEMVVSRFEDQKIAEEWVVSELAAELMLKQPRK